MRVRAQHPEVMDSLSIWAFKKVRFMIRKRFLLLLFSVIILPMGCQDELADRYLNSDKATSANLGQFFTAILNNDRMRPSYGEISTFVNWHIGVYTQSVGFLNNPTIFQQNESY